MSDQALILQTLQTKAREAVEASSVPALPIAYVNVTFDPAAEAADGKYLELVFIPNDPSDRYWNGRQVQAGMFRFVLHWPKGAAAYDAMNLLEEIVAPFTKTALLPVMKISDSPKPAGAVDGGADMLFPASLRYSRY